MKIARGICEDGSVTWARVEETSERHRYYRLPGPPAQEKEVSREEVRLVRLLAPVSDPKMMLCIGINYHEHADSLGVARPAYPVVVPKGINAILDPDGTIELPRHLPSDKVDYEVELAVVLARDTKNVSVEKALDGVLGYTCANDVSARDWQFEKGGGQWARGKSFDTFAPLGPYLVTPESIGDVTALGIRSYVNGEQRQSSSTARMIFSVAEIISFLSASSTLPAGTVILTGTPSGVGMKRNPPVWLKEGDVVRMEIDGIGALTNPVGYESEAKP